MWQAGCYSNAEHAVIWTVSENGHTFPDRFNAGPARPGTVGGELRLERDHKPEYAQIEPQAEASQE
jgi:hypothetical protein